MQLINNPETDPYVKIAFIYEFAQILKKYFGSSVTSLALNKANEIIAFNPTLFQELEQKKQKPRATTSINKSITRKKFSINFKTFLFFKRFLR